jgi:hypothetical protein
MFELHSRTRNPFVILSPAGSRVSGFFRKIEFDNIRHSRLLSAIQRLRGATYLEDGAIRPEDLTADGRHQTAADDHAWHVFSLDSDGKPGACLRFLDESHSAGFRGLWVSHAAMAHCPQLGWKLRMAVERKLELARASRIGFGSVGGWAVSPSQRRTTQPVAIILAAYGLLELLGGFLGTATATFRHKSASILRKIGLCPLTWDGADLPSYFDPQYGCAMEILQFDSSKPNPKYRESVERFRDQLLYAPVICREAMASYQAHQHAMFAVA